MFSVCKYGLDLKPMFSVCKYGFVLKLKLNVFKYYLDLKPAVYVAYKWRIGLMLPGSSDDRTDHPLHMGVAALGHQRRRASRSDRLPAHGRQGRNHLQTRQRQEGEGTLRMLLNGAHKEGEVLRHEQHHRGL